MKASYKLVLTLLAGATLAAATIHGIRAQGKPLAYVVVDIADMTDAELFRTIYPKGLASVSAFDGRYIIRTEKITSLDVTAPKRFVVIAFDSVETAKAWSSSPAQKEINAIRAQLAKSRSFIAKGM